MKEISQYVCEFCGTRYNKKDVCLECENQHRIPLEVIGAEHLPKNVSACYPVRINVVFNDGFVVRYEKTSAQWKCETDKKGATKYGRRKAD